MNGTNRQLLQKLQ